MCLRYAASKWTAECVVSSALRAGVKGCILRLGLVAGDTQSGACQARDFFSRLLAGFVHVDAFPETDSKRHMMVHALPVDCTAVVIIELSENHSFTGAQNVVSGAPLLPMSQLREWLLRFDYVGHHVTPATLPVLAFPAWMARAKLDGQLSVWPVLSWAEEQAEFPVFNTKLPPCALEGAVTADTLRALTRGVEEACVHRMMKRLFSDS